MRSAPKPRSRRPSPLEVKSIFGWMGAAFSDLTCTCTRSARKNSCAATAANAEPSAGIQADTPAGEVVESVEEGNRSWSTVSMGAQTDVKVCLLEETCKLACMTNASIARKTV